MKFLATVVFALTLLLIWALQTKFGDIPPIGKFLNPVSGFWQNAESTNSSSGTELQLDGLRDKVIVRYDEHHIPHIFAKNDHDLYYVQGYLTAKDRLWQMDIQTRAAAGRLSEVVGPKALDIDRYHRRIGMTYGANNTLKGLMKDSISKMTVMAYSDGVNSYISHLNKKDYPIEFKLLDYAPEKWEYINCAYLLKNMSETLSGGSDDFEMTNNLKVFGAKTVRDLFPDYPFHEDPIIPAGTKWDFKPLPLPKPSADFIANTSDTIKPQKIVPGVGSNNWAIAGSKSANGFPILANDPHLNLTFPSIWYQVQLSSPTVNVYGVSLPGAPEVIIGYNQNISWGVTNVDADVLDWYQIKFKDQSKTEYWYDNKWVETSKKVEEIKVRGQATVYDTVFYTLHGPVVYDKIAQRPKGRTNVPVGDAMRWIAHDESDDFQTFYLLNRAKNYDDYRKALTYFTSPAQNFIFADREKDIAITPNGKLPLKFRDQGKFVMDGSDPANNWQGWIPADQNPTVKNPPRGFVSSANQSSTDQTYPYYINWRFEQYYRASRINGRLTAMNKATVDSMRLLQMDTYSTLARDVLPTMLKYINPATLNENQAKGLSIIKNWDKYYAEDSEGASIFDAWWDNFFHLTWDDKFSRKDIALNFPSYDQTARLLLTEPGSIWFDNSATKNKETCSDIVNMALQQAIDGLVKTKGQPGKKWAWGLVKETFINHLANLPGFGTGSFSAGGRGNVVNALRWNTGPSWRMVVQLGPKVKGYGVFPGGESGNPGSHYYDDMFDTWKNGQLNELLFLHSADEKSDRVKSTLILKSK